MTHNNNDILICFFCWNSSYMKMIDLIQIVNIQFLYSVFHFV